MYTILNMQAARFVQALHHAGSRAEIEAHVAQAWNDPEFELELLPTSDNILTLRAEGRPALAIILREESCKK